MFGRKTVYYKNGKYVGELSGRGKRHGYGVFINSNSVSLLGRWMNDNLIKAIINYEDGSKYIGSLLNGDYHGRGLRLTKSKNWTNVNQYDVTIGLWEYGRLNGTLIFSKPDGLYMKKYYKNGELYKSIIVDNDDSEVSLFNYQNNKYHGKCYTFNLNTGYLASATYEYGVQKPIIF